MTLTNVDTTALYDLPERICPRDSTWQHTAQLAWFGCAIQTTWVQCIPRPRKVSSVLNLRTTPLPSVLRPAVLTCWGHRQPHSLCSVACCVYM